MTAGAAPLVLTLGDPAGVGPEIAADAWRALSSSGPVFAVIGDAELLRLHAPVLEVTHAGDAAAVFGRALPVLHRPLRAPVTPGAPDPANAPVVADWIEEAVSLALSGEAGGVVTCPIAKAPMYASGFRFPGHTEFIAELTIDTPFSGVRGPVMMLTARDLRACLVTIHVAFDQVDFDREVRVFLKSGGSTLAQGFACFGRSQGFLVTLYLSLECHFLDAFDQLVGHAVSSQNAGQVPMAFGARKRHSK